MELRIKAAQTRSVSARELSRRMADLIDEIETEGLALVILRYGRPAALLVPIEPNVRRAPRRTSIETIETAQHEEEIDLSELDDDQRRLLLAMLACAPERYSPDTWVGPIDSFSRAFVRLEMARFVEKNVAGRYLTEKGERAAGLLRGGATAA